MTCKDINYCLYFLSLTFVIRRLLLVTSISDFIDKCSFWSRILKILTIKISETSFAQRFDDSMWSFSSEKRINLVTWYKVNHILRNNNIDKSTINYNCARHFNLPGHSHEHMEYCGVCLHLGNNETRKRKEQSLIFKLGTLAPNGINERFSFA